MQTHIMLCLHVEGEPSGQVIFNGFLVDVNKADGARYAGQVGRVRFSRSMHIKMQLLPSGIEIKRDT